jgi:hypothetical protein
MMKQLKVFVIIVAMAGIAVAQQYGAMPELGPGMSPRYFFGISPLMKRQSGSCGANMHPCKLIPGLNSSEITQIAQARTSISRISAVATTTTAMSTL